jgi:class 3 adenylate cyclase
VRALVVPLLSILSVFGADPPRKPDSPPKPAPSVEHFDPTKARHVLRRLLDRRIDADKGGKKSEVEAIDKEIRDRFEKKLAVLVSDMTGFTAKTKESGIIPFLADIRRLFHLAEPIVEKHGASWVKVDADDLFITAPDPRAMFALARDLQAAVAAHNQADPVHKIGLSIGLGFGPTLVVEHDVFGDAVNTASKLGEDIGKAGEILITESMMTAAGADSASRCTRVENFDARGSKYPFFTCRP